MLSTKYPRLFNIIWNRHATVASFWELTYQTSIFVGRSLVTLQCQGTKYDKVATIELSPEQGAFHVFSANGYSGPVRF